MMKRFNLDKTEIILFTRINKFAGHLIIFNEIVLIQSTVESRNVLLSIKLYFLLNTLSNLTILQNIPVIQVCEVVVFW